MAADVVPVGAPAGKIVLWTVRGEAVLEPFEKKGRDAAVVDELGEEVAHHERQRSMVVGDRRELWVGLFGAGDDGEPEAVECLHRYAVGGFVAEAFMDAGFHFLACVAGERQEEEGGRRDVLAVQEPGRLGYENGRFSAARGSDDEVSRRIGNDGAALFVGEGVRLDGIEKLAGRGELAGYEDAVCVFAEQVGFADEVE